MKYSLAKHSRKEKLTKDDIPAIFKPVIDVMQSIFPHWRDHEDVTHEFGPR